MAEPGVQNLNGGGSPVVTTVDTGSSAPFAPGEFAKSAINETPPGAPIFGGIGQTPHEVRLTTEPTEPIVDQNSQSKTSELTPSQMVASLAAEMPKQNGHESTPIDDRAQVADAFIFSYEHFRAGVKPLEEKKKAGTPLAPDEQTRLDAAVNLGNAVKTVTTTENPTKKDLQSDTAVNPTDQSTVRIPMPEMIAFLNSRSNEIRSLRDTLPTNSPLYKASDDEWQRMVLQRSILERNQTESGDLRLPETTEQLRKRAETALTVAKTLVGERAAGLGDKFTRLGTDAKKTLDKLNLGPLVTGIPLAGLLAGGTLLDHHPIDLHDALTPPPAHTATLLTSENVPGIALQKEPGFIVIPPPTEKTQTSTTNPQASPIAGETPDTTREQMNTERKNEAKPLKTEPYTFKSGDTWRGIAKTQIEKVVKEGELTEDQKEALLQRVWMVDWKNTANQNPNPDNVAVGFNAELENSDTVRKMAEFVKAHPDNAFAKPISPHDITSLSELHTQADTAKAVVQGLAAV